MFSAAFICALLVLLIAVSGSSEHVHTGGYNHICGSEWKKEYEEKHKAMISGERKGKYIVMVPIESGLGDILLGYVQGFIWALLTDRSFLILHDEHLRRPEYTAGYCLQRTIEHAYEPRSFNWVAPFVNKSHYNCLAPLYENMPGCKSGELRLLPTDKEPLTYSHVYQVNGGYREFFYGQNGHNLSNTPHESSDILFFVSNRGVTYHMFDNPDQKARLESMGLKRESMFGCMFHHLFRIKPEVCKDGCRQTEKHLLAAAQDPNTLRIGVHVRSPTLEVAPEHFKCVDELKTHYESEGKKIVILLLSMNERLQANMKTKYGDQLLLSQGVPTASIDIHDRKDHRDATTNCTETVAKDKEAMIESARDFHLLGHTDIQIISRDSGFGVVGALNRPREKSIVYKMHIGQNGPTPNCAENLDGDDLSVFADQWSGL